MTKAELVSEIAQKSDVTKKVAETMLKTLIESVTGTLQETGEIRIDGLGTFKVVERKARTGVNPQTGAKMDIPATKVPAFRPAKSLKEAVKK
jgi:DNA-binding protein HU-beta